MLTAQALQGNSRGDPAFANAAGRPHKAEQQAQPTLLSIQSIRLYHGMAWPGPPCIDIELVLFIIEGATHG